MCEIKRIENRDSAIVGQLLQIWERSVRATHLFLSPQDIVELKPEVITGLLCVEQLLGFYDMEGNVKAFLGVNGTKIEMLFVDEACHGEGIGRNLVEYARRTFNITEVDVNEQNNGAYGFYLHMGFTVTGRSPQDSAGRPFPIIHLKFA